VANRILIIKPSSLGDVATTLPMLCDLRRAYPDAKIDWLIHPSLTALLQGHDAINDLILFDRKKLASWWYKPSALSLFRKLLKQLRAARYDLVIDAQGLFRSGFLARYTGAKTRIGFATAREGATLFYTHKVPLPNRGKTMLAVDRMRALLAPLHIDTTTPAQFRLPVQVTQHSAFRIPNSFVAIIPGARWNTKRWDIERYIEITRKLLADGQHVLLLGSPDEKPLCDQIQAAAPAATNLAGQTTLAQMIALLDRASLILGNDSGPLHVAVALGKPIVAIYGPTSPDFVGPYGQLQNVLRHDVPCHPCRLRECDHHSCMKGVPVELVWEKMKQVSNPPTKV